MAIIDKSSLTYGKNVIDIDGPDGNAFALMGIGANYLKRYLGYTKDEIDDFRNEMMAGDYENLLLVFDKYLGDYFDLHRTFK
jgi:hypothetical protein